jgi:hypothetical protein
MLKNIVFEKVQQIQVLATYHTDADANITWTVQLRNLYETDITGVLVSTRGYGTNAEGTYEQTSTLRHFFERVSPQALQAIELISPEIFYLSNEYWVSFYIENQIFDKKFVFAPNQISEENLTFLDDQLTQAIVLS